MAKTTQAQLSKDAREDMTLATMGLWKAHHNMRLVQYESLGRGMNDTERAARKAVVAIAKAIDMIEAVRREAEMAAHVEHPCAFMDDQDARRATIAQERVSGF